MQVIISTKALSYQNLSAMRELQQDRKPICPNEVMSVTEECCIQVLGLFIMQKECFNYLYTVKYLCYSCTLLLRAKMISKLLHSIKRSKL